MWSCTERARETRVPRKHRQTLLIQKCLLFFLQSSLASSSARKWPKPQRQFNVRLCEIVVYLFVIIIGTACKLIWRRTTLDSTQLRHNHSKNGSTSHQFVATTAGKFRYYVELSVIGTDLPKLGPPQTPNNGLNEKIAAWCSGPCFGSDHGAYPPIPRDAQHLKSLGFFSAEVLPPASSSHDAAVAEELLFGWDAVVFNRSVTTWVIFAMKNDW